jgi:hypothetical protein
MSKVIVTFSDGYLESLLKLINDEIQRNIKSGDYAYKKYWENFKKDIQLVQS